MKKISKVEFITAATMGLLLTVLFGYVFYTQVFMESERTYPFDHASKFNTGWHITYEGEEQDITLPFYYDFEKGKQIVIKNVAPSDMMDYNTLLIWNSVYDIKVYVGDELVFDYDENDIHNIGRDRPYMYLWVNLPPFCANEEITIVYEASVSISPMYLGSIYIGERASVLAKILQPYKLEVFFSLFALMMSIICIAVGISFRKNIGQQRELIYIGISAALVALWILGDSLLRQFIVHNVSGFRNMAFLVIPFFPTSFMLYLDITQNEKYHKLYHVIEGIGLIDFVVIFTLHITGVMGLSESFRLTAVICVLTIITGFTTIIIDIAKKRINRYLWSTIGIFVFGISGIIQIIFYLKENDSISGGIFLLSGLLVMLICSIINAGVSVGRIRREKHDAEDKVRTVSIEALETIAKTVDAKDAYTSKHSERVAAFAIALARACDRSEEEINNIKYGAILHDIGKIGIPDAVLNKPGKLTDEEYDIIKSHTLIGGDIMKKMSSMPGGDTIARYHHERYDGKGYPEGLKGKEIPKAARIVGIADAYDAMNSKRVYRQNLTKEVIREELVKGRGTQFDPKLLDKFLEMFDSGELDMIEKELDEHLQE